MTGTRSFLLIAAVALLSGFAGAAAWDYSGMGDARLRSYLVENPDILPEMAAAYDAKQTRERLASAGSELTQPFPGAVLGNPEGAVTLVEFSDYACGYCRMSREHVEALVAANPDLKVVIREWPIFDGSEETARMALAAAKQGKFAAFHNAMFTGGQSGPAALAEAASKAGLDMEAARSFAASDGVSAELARNTAMARQLGFGGTPSWIVGDKVMEGAVGPEELQAAIDAARGS